MCPALGKIMGTFRENFVFIPKFPNYFPLKIGKFLPFLRKKNKFPHDFPSVEDSVTPQRDFSVYFAIFKIFFKFFVFHMQPNLSSKI